MLRLVSTVTALSLAYICEHPALVGKVGLELQLERHFLLAWLAKQVYRSASGIYEIIHHVQPGSSVDEIARFEWTADRDAELVARIQRAVEELKALQTTEVPIEYTANKEYVTMFDEMKQSYPEFTNWHDLGFQGKNPATDFRGAGKLGVIFFHSFCIKHPEQLKSIIAESRTNTETASDLPWYPLALVSIRITNALAELLKREKLLVIRLLQSHNASSQQNQDEWLQVVQNVHDQLLVQLHTTWLRAEKAGEVKTYFDNEFILKKFEQSLPLRIYNIPE